MLIKIDDKKPGEKLADKDLEIFAGDDGTIATTVNCSHPDITNPITSFRRDWISLF